MTYREWKNQIINSLGGKCIKCNNKEDLHLDHIDPNTKLFSISRKWSVADKELLDNEIAKCQLLCKKCHESKTAIERSGFTHGTTYGWMKAKCTCNICSTAKEEYNKQRNSSRRIGKEKGSYYKSELPPHGTSARYNRKCRCIDCKKANSEKEKLRRQSKNLPLVDQLVESRDLKSL